MKPPVAESRSRAVLLSTAAVACAGSLAAGTIALAAGGVEVRVGENAEVSRVEIHGAEAAVRREGDVVIVRLPRTAQPDLARLRVDPPRGVARVETRGSPKGLELLLTLEKGADATFGRADGGTYVHIFGGREAKAARPDPAPEGGVLKIEAAVTGGQAALRFPWRTPLGSAVFRRGDAVWIVFDAKAKLDVSALPKTLGPAGGVRWAAGADFTAVRVQAPDGVSVDAAAEGAVWTVTFGAPVRKPEVEIKPVRDDRSGPTALTAALAGATKVVWLTDPMVGDRFAAVTALAPRKASVRRRGFVEGALPTTVHGLAVEAIAGDLAVTIEGEKVRIARPGGLNLSGPGYAAGTVPDEMPKPAAAPALVDFDNWPKTGEGGFAARYAQLQDLAAREGAEGAAAPVVARMALARFLVGSELSYEAVGVLNLLARTNETVLSDPEFRGLRGAARAMVGRHKEAQADFAAPPLMGDRSAALWRGYVEAKQGAWAEARKAFAEGASVIDSFSPKWRARFAVEHARAAVETGDLPAARALLAYAFEQDVAPLEQLAARLVQARVFELDGDAGRALAVYEAVGRASLDAVAAPALLRATKIKLDQGLVAPAEGVRELDGLRYRWRGDSTELEIIRTLGDIYLGQGRYREALDALRSAGGRLPDLPAAMQLQADLSAAFRALFLEGQADGLEPIQALALFFDFRELTPVGAEGDEMVRRLSRRLVDVDLLDQAAELLQYQVDNRLDGVAKAQVAADLALVRLMDRDPEAALRAIWGTRSTVLPSALAAERRVLEARALSDLGRHDHALEVLGKDASPEATEARAEVLWRKKDWAAAAPLLERRLGERWKDSAPLSPEQETRLIRAGIAYTLAGDDAGLKRLAQRWQGFVAGARQPDAVRVALFGFDAEKVGPGEFTRVAAQADSFTGWVAAMKQKFRDRPASSPTYALPVRTAALAVPVADVAPTAPAKPAPRTPAAKRKPEDPFF